MAATQVIQPPSRRATTRPARLAAARHGTEAQRAMYDQTGKPLASSSANLARANALYDENSRLG